MVSLLYQPELIQFLAIQMDGDGLMTKMMNKATKTHMPTWEEAKAGRKWILVDANGKVLGRLATDIALKLRGKDRPDFTRHVDSGNFIVVINAKNVLLTGNKLEDKIYYSHSGYLGGLKEISAGERLKKKPTELLRDAVWGMLPKSALSRQMMKKLKIYAGDKHPHVAQLATTGAQK